MYYFSIVLFLLFKIPPKKKHIRRFSVSLSKREYMSMYEHIINSYDNDVMLYTQKDCINVSFIGSGYSDEVINSYRKLELKDYSLFEKIYFNARKMRVSFFVNNILPQLLKHEVRTARLIEVSEGEKFFITYFEYLDLEPPEPGSYFHNAANIAANIATTKFDESIEFAGDRIEYNRGTFQRSVEKLRDELVTQICDISKFLSDVDSYLSVNVERCLNHGDLSDKNTFKNEKVIDWDNFGFYPVGYDFGLIIGLAHKKELTLKKYLELEYELYLKVSGLVSKENFQISLPYFTAIFIRSYRVRNRYENEDRNRLFSVKLISLLKERFASLE